MKKFGPKYKICRRLGAGVYEQCQTQKFVLSEGRHKRIGTKKPKALSGYGTQLIEKQKIRFSYGVSEKQFSNYVKRATAIKGGSPAERLFGFLETRLDNVVYRLGLAHTRALARQMVAHGHFVINGTRTTVPSYTVRAGDTITVREGSKKSALFANIAAKMKTYTVPAWLVMNAETLTATVQHYPKNTETFLDFNAVLEFYSR